MGVRQRQAGDRLPHRGGGDADDPPPAALAHPRQRRVDQGLRGEHQLAVGGLELFTVGVGGGARRRPAGIEDEDVERTECRFDLARKQRQPLEIVGVGDEDGGRAVDLRRDPLEVGGRAGGERDRRALAPERQRDPAADPARGAHHQRGAPFQPEVHSGRRYRRSATFTNPGRLAQLGEHLPYKQRVTGSNPVVPTI